MVSIVSIVNDKKVAAKKILLLSEEFLLDDPDRWDDVVWILTSLAFDVFHGSEKEHRALINERSNAQYDYVEKEIGHLF